MAEGMQTSLGIQRRTISRSKHHAGSSDGCADRSGARDAHAHGARSLISRAGNDRSSSFQTRGLGTCVRNFSADLRRFVQCRQQSNVNRRTC